MKIEISEVFVTRTDAITLDRVPCPIGIAALEISDRAARSRGRPSVNKRLQPLTFEPPTPKKPTTISPANTY